MPEVPDRGQGGPAFLIAAMFNLAGLGLALYLPFDIVFRGFGIVQLAWLGPLWRYYRNKGKTEDAKVVLVVAGLTFLLNAACWMGSRVRL